MRPHFYTLDEAGDPVPCADMLTWAVWFAQADRTVARTELPSGCVVSTVFLGINHNFRDGDPVLWETMSFGGDYDLACDRYRSKEDALVGHELWVLVAKGEVTPFDARRLKMGFPSAEVGGESGGDAQKKKQGKAPA